MSFTWRKSVCSIALTGLAGCANMGGLDPGDRIETTKTSMSEPLQCLGRVINSQKTQKILVLFLQPVSNGTVTPASPATELSLAGKNFLQTALINQLKTKKVIVPAIEPKIFVKLYQKNLSRFLLYALVGSFSEFKTTSGSGLGLAGEASHEKNGGRASADFNSESAQLALDMSLINISTGLIADNESLRIGVNKNRDGFTLAFGFANGGVGLNLGGMEADSAHAKQRTLIEAALYALLARGFNIPEQKCLGGMAGQPVPEPARHSAGGNRRVQRKR